MKALDENGVIHSINNRVGLDQASLSLNEGRLEYSYKTYNSSKEFIKKYKRMPPGMDKLPQYRRRECMYNWTNPLQWYQTWYV